MAYSLVSADKPTDPILYLYSHQGQGASMKQKLFHVKESGIASQDPTSLTPQRVHTLKISLYYSALVNGAFSSKLN